MTHPPTRRSLLALAAAVALGPRRVAASTSPKALQIVVPAPPGSQPDLLARWLVEPMARVAGVPGTVSNRPGAAGAIAADAVLAAPLEAGALLLGGLDHVAYVHLQNNRRPLDPFVEFVPVGTVNRDSWLVVVGPGGPEALSKLADAARRAGGLHYASGGEGSTAHLLAARLCRALAVDAVHVPYRDPWLPDLVAGRVQLAVAPTPAVLGAVRGGQLRALATLSPERLAVAAGVPTVAELGHPGLAFQGGLFLFAPAGLAALAPRLNGWLREAMADPEVARRYHDAGIDPAPLELEAAHTAVRGRLREVDAMRLAVFGRAR